jgi:lipopolysaccharide/colanic/teichoic acid biosynthesis glycosyltransferase
MQLIIIHKGDQNTHSRDSSLFRFALSSSPVAGAVLEGLAKWPWPTCKPEKTLIAFPKDWGSQIIAEENRIIPYLDNVFIPEQTLRKAGRQKWICISNARFVTKIAPELIEKMLAAFQADLIAVNVSRELMAYNENARILAQGKLVGFRRLYSDSFEPVPTPDNWPHCVFIRTDCFKQVLNGSGLSRHFPALLARCKSASARIVSVKIGGKVMDLDTEDGLLAFCNAILGSVAPVSYKGTAKNHIAGANQCNHATDSSNPLFFGRVLLGKNVQIDPRAVIVGPTIIGDGVRVEGGAVITSSVIGPNVLVPAGQVVQNRVVAGTGFKHLSITDHTKSCDYGQNISYAVRRPPADNNNVINGGKSSNGTFRIWSGFSYAGFLKRIADIIAAGIALVLFAPFFPIIAFAIKLSSKGPLFFKDKRQGLYGKEFNCIKFRTMMVGADDMQDKLRELSQVDGPQFKMGDDPRVNNVGRFLRATYIDEVPQFINVLLGQMSVVGPRPSPEAENELCPSWRYARLSVRPGITGLWQVLGNREPLKDFQEWIYYDVKYVKELSLRMDLWICYKTARKIIKLFVQHL